MDISKDSSGRGLMTFSRGGGGGQTLSRGRDQFAFSYRKL